MFFATFSGFGFGLITAIPIAGPISALVFSQAMRGKYSQARWIALGASLVEAVYAFLAFWGFARLVNEFAWLILASKIFAAVLLCGLGVYFFRSKKMRRPEVQDAQSPKMPPAARRLSAFLMGAGVCAANPSLLATWGATIAALYSMKWFSLTDANAAGFSAGIAGGIFVWFVLFVGLIRKHRGRISGRLMDRILKAIGVTLLALGGWVLIRILKDGV